VKTIALKISTYSASNGQLTKTSAGELARTTYFFVCGGGLASRATFRACCKVMECGLDAGFKTNFPVTELRYAAAFAVVLLMDSLWSLMCCLATAPRDIFR
jgi:hypothetical protein